MFYRIQLFSRVSRESFCPFRPSTASSNVTSEFETYDSKFLEETFFIQKIKLNSFKDEVVFKNT